MTNTELSNRLKQPRKQWVKASLWSLIYILFIVWVGTYAWLVLLPLIFDAFITRFIPWTWWKKSKNKKILAFMGWVDAVLFALVAVYFINTYLFQNYQIPTSSLEKTLLVGDFLFVSKASYGPRVPNTPLSFPLVQHTFPILNTKSFIEKPHWDYKRLKGFDTIDRNDIVVFNFPTGDTVALKIQNPDYYTLCHLYGRDFVNNRKDIYGDIVYRPVDRRENYVKRCVGIAGDWIQIKNNQLFVNEKPQQEIKGLQYNYFVQTDGTSIDKALDRLEISLDDRIQVTNQEFIKSIGLDPYLPVYHFPLTKEAMETLRTITGVKDIIIEQPNKEDYTFPLNGGKNWTRDNMGPIWIPKKGVSITLNQYNYPLYERAIRVYENNTLEVKDGKFYINNVLRSSYTFKMNYYWMMGDNRHNSSDSRYWGFVPEDHIVGRPILVWLSLNKDKNWLNGKIRFNRFFKWAEN